MWSICCAPRKDWRRGYRTITIGIFMFGIRLQECCKEPRPSHSVERNRVSVFRCQATYYVLELLGYGLSRLGFKWRNSTRCWKKTWTTLVVYIFRTTNDTKIPFGLYDTETYKVLCTPSIHFMTSCAGHQGGTGVLAMFVSACLHPPVRLQL